MKRIIGFDLARAVAITGMVVVNFKVVMYAEQRGPEWLRATLGLLDGRAAAMFVILAGVGASLMAARARRDRDLAALWWTRGVLLRRALVLLVVGYPFLLIWPADILHYYACYLAIGTMVLTASDRILWLWAVLAAALFALLYWVAGYWDQLDAVELTYDGLWTPVGLVRNLVFNGWHPVLPWVAFYLVGMWLGRRDVLDRAVRWRIIGAAAAVAAAAELVAWLRGPIEFDVVTRGPSSLGLTAGVGALLAADPLPPGPVYLAAAGGTAVAAILLCVEVGLRWGAAPPFRWAAATGELALTVYFAHVLLGMGTLKAAGLLHSQTLWFSLGAAAGFMVVAVGFSVLWRRRFVRGPVEWLMHRTTG